MSYGKLWIGWSRGEITPPRKTFVSGQFHTRISATALSPLTATALALEVRDAAGGSDQVVFLSCDLAIESCKPDLLKKLAGRCADLDLTKLTLNCTHTHNAPATARGVYPEPADDPEFMNPDEYRDWLTTGLADIVATAWQDRQPGSLARGFGYAVVGRCRRAVYADGTALMYGNTDRADFQGFEGCDDHAVNLLFTRDQSNQLSGIVVNLACPAQSQEGLADFSADFWHEVRRGIAEEFGGQVHLLPQCAPAGDMSPHLLADKTEEHDLRSRLGVDKQGIIGRRIMAAVREALASAAPAQDTLELVHEVATLQLPRLMVSRDQYELEKRLHQMSPAELALQPFGFQRLWPFGLVCDLVKRYEQQDANPCHQVESHIIRLGDVAVATNPFELFVDYGMRIRCRSLALQTFLVQLADSNGDGFYLPTQRALEGGHYSAHIKSNWVGPEGGQLLVDATVRSINQQFEGASYPRAR